jgi:hypothetical protein
MHVFLIDFMALPLSFLGDIFFYLANLQHGCCLFFSSPYLQFGDPRYGTWKDVRGFVPAGT